ncbi:MAG TPA: hypothetical protein VJ023_07035 [Pyrinomonadaceae bacterium]|nr:hypothetical protein [Pyrinomonadaceae bacterium]
MSVKQLSLLIVDDDDRMRQMMASLLSDRYRSVTAAAFAELGSSISELACNQIERITKQDAIF